MSALEKISAAEDKVAVIKRLGRSPDKADAVIMASRW